MKVIKKLSNKVSHQNKQTKFLIYLLAFGIIGGLIIYLSHAAVIQNAFEPESGAISGSATTGSDSNSSNGFIAFHKAGAQCPSGQVGTPPNCVPASSALGVNAGIKTKPFKDGMRGQAYSIWALAGSPLINDIGGLPQATAAMRPGLIRYLGGLEINKLGWSANTGGHGAVNVNGNNYQFHYSGDELKSVDAFAKTIGATVMMQTNVKQYDPGMWADMVRFIKANNLTSITSYELGNESDTGNPDASMSQADYVRNSIGQLKAIKAVDPSAHVVVGALGLAFDYGCIANIPNCSPHPWIVDAFNSAHAQGVDFDEGSYHWYQNSRASIDQPLVYKIGNSNDGRKWADYMTAKFREGTVANPRALVGISELGLDDNDLPSNGNYVAALWMSDMLAREANNGTDWATMWDTYNNQTWAFIYGGSGDLHLRPTYYAEVMYAQWFGDQMVQSSSNDPDHLSVWASTDSKDPGKLKLRITNMTGNAISTPVALSNFSARSAVAYVLKSGNPLSNDMSDGSVSINGAKINAMNAAASINAIPAQNVTVSNNSISTSFPAYSSTAIVVSQ